MKLNKLGLLTFSIILAHLAGAEVKAHVPEAAFGDLVDAKAMVVGVAVTDNPSGIERVGGIQDGINTLLVNHLSMAEVAGHYLIDEEKDKEEGLMRDPAVETAEHKEIEAKLADLSDTVSKLNDTLVDVARKDGAKLAQPKRGSVENSGGDHAVAQKYLRIIHKGLLTAHENAETLKETGDAEDHKRVMNLISIVSQKQQDTFHGPMKKHYSKKGRKKAEK